MFRRFMHAASRFKCRLPRLCAPSDASVLAAFDTGKGVIYGIAIALVYAKLRGVW